MLQLVLSIITLPLLLTESLSGYQSLDQKLYFHLDCLLAATITVENFDTNWIPHSFSKCFRNVLYLVFQTSLLRAKVRAPHLLPSPSRTGERFPS